MLTYEIRWGVTTSYTLPRIIICKWELPIDDRVMLNTDGSRNNRGAGYGAIDRDGRGNPLGAAAGSSQPKAIVVHELQGLQVGLRLVISKGCRKVSAMVDSSNVVSYFMQTQSPLGKL